MQYSGRHSGHLTIRHFPIIIINYITSVNNSCEFKTEHLKFLNNTTISYNNVLSSD